MRVTIFRTSEHQHISSAQTGREFCPSRASGIAVTDRNDELHARVQLVASVLLCLSAGLAGCADDDVHETLPLPVMVSEHMPERQTESAIREVNREELQTLITTSSQPVLVEFSVLTGCYRCDDMRSPIRQKAAELQQRADVVRIDFNRNQQLAREVGATVCPSYVVYSGGRISSVRTWPTSADFVADDVRTAAGNHQTKAASQSPEPSDSTGSIP